MSKLVLPAVVATGLLLLAGCAAVPAAEEPENAARTAKSSPQPTEASESPEPDAETEPESGDAPCELADADDIFTPAFYDIYVNDNGWNQQNSREAFIERRCSVPDDATVIQLFRDNGVQLDGISTGTNDTSIFYLGTNGECQVQVAYYPADGNWSHEYSDDAGASRVATPAEVVAHELANC